MELPLRAQGTLLTGVRGCDLAPKHAEASSERELVAFLRCCILVPHDAREVDVPNAFFKSAPPVKWKPSEYGHYPQHWYAHIMHCFEVVGYLHPHGPIADAALYIYIQFVNNLHLRRESRSELLERVNEDRIAMNSVVS